MKRLRLFLARLLLPRGWKAMSEWDEMLLAASGAATATQGRAVIQMVRQSGALVMYVNGVRLMWRGADTLTQEQADKPNGIGGCGPLSGLRSPSHWDRIPEPPKEPEKS